MNVISQHCKTLVTAAKPLPLVVREPALLKRWLLKPAKARLFLFAGLLVYLVLATQLSQAIVDVWHPLNQHSLKTGVMELLNSPILRKLQNLREVRYWQLLSLFWIIGLSIASIILILDLPRSIGEDEPLPSENKKAQPAGNSGEIAKTQIISSVEKKVRYVGSDRRYRIDKAIASGGSGIVYQAEDTVLGRKVALKELLEDVASDAEQAQRFKSEARALALLNHAHILPIYDLLEENGRFWLVMELLTGGTLKEKIDAGALDTAQTKEVIKGLASALETAHQKGFVHRDIKPANILFSKEGSFRITDFGIAKHQATGIKTSHGLILGSPGYMSPEQAAGEPVDARSDIYSLGITMFQMLTGDLPFQGDVSSVMAQHITKPAPPPSTINASIAKELDRIVLKMLAKKPEARFQSMAELTEALNKFN
ncbi:MAG: serine/threonine protein kinase [Gammaproteobacteria bacterium]|nr:MAG: serine/threonine protein kinase [Gammaproteobacteria bacterium]